MTLFGKFKVRIKFFSQVLLVAHGWKPSKAHFHGQFHNHSMAIIGKPINQSIRLESLQNVKTECLKCYCLFFEPNRMMGALVRLP